MSSPGPVLRGRRSAMETLERLVTDARAGHSRVLVLRGEAGIGKSALLDHMLTLTEGCRVVRATGVESEMELTYAGLQQLCAPFLDRLEHLPGPQRDALSVAFGLTGGGPPDRFLVGLAVLTLFADVAEQQPLVCVVDDAQWLDRMSRQALGFASRRLLAERICVVLAVRDGCDEDELTALPELVVGGLSDTDAGVLLDSVFRGPMDRRVRDRIIAETRGNPLALLELPRAWTAAELADGFDETPLKSRIEQGFQRQLDQLPADTRKLLLTAAAEPLGDATLLWRAAGVLGLGADPAAAAEATGLIEFGARVRFRHPLVRSAAYRSGSLPERQEVHRALAEVTDAIVDPDRRAWHRAQATSVPDEDVAADLEHTAGRTRARGGLLAAAAFLERAALLTPDPANRSRRELTAATLKRDAGALDAALRLLGAVESGPPDPLRAAEVEYLRGQIAFDQRRGTDAAKLLLSAATRLEPLDGDRAREAYLAALSAAMWAESGVVEAAHAALAAPRTANRPVDLVLDAVATYLSAGHDAAAPIMAEALDALRSLDTGEDDVSRSLWLMGNRAGGILATEMWDYDSVRALAQRQVQLARDSGARVQLQFALNFLANTEVVAGNLSAAESMIDEDRLLAEVSGIPPVAYTSILLAAYRGHGADLIETTAREAAQRGQGRVVTFANYANAVLHNGLGQHDVARDAARRVIGRDVIGYDALILPELAEAASRTGDEPLLAAAVERVSKRAQALRTPWALGMDARLRALQSPQADLYRESIEQLGRTPLRVEVARSHLLFGEWLRREGHRADAREHLRTAHDMLTEMGLAAFAERARRELLATGETVRKRTVETTDELTAQESQIARLAKEGLSNPEIGARLFISPRTVEWHLHKVFPKLGITSRRQLRQTELPGR
ncbi:helix-turn-helix transcriptional regulator [Kibdelosporangium aridum]|uniref:Helix-turn-helix transcriptional regulator n=1 Tax=Kibdelosporangium aridum TaxID=2030 RepID=A0A428ZUZ4_KIBAR|nr:LuxR family transcriptional regulator [Kibdelosporangium aridum]RSM91867.1 helix-turn-helix transcriptional regulator [Kibdelosporangium aridum]